VSTLAELRDDPRVRGALAKAIEWADACDAAARELVAYDSPSLSPIEQTIAVATAAGMAAQAWAAVHHATRPNGAVP
jgi:hypothetical protein